METSVSLRNQCEASASSLSVFKDTNIKIKLKNGSLLTVSDSRSKKLLVLLLATADVFKTRQ